MLSLSLSLSLSPSLSCPLEKDILAPVIFHTIAFSQTSFYLLLPPSLYSKHKWSARLLHSRGWQRWLRWATASHHTVLAIAKAAMARWDQAMGDSTHRRQDTVSSPLGVCVFDEGIYVRFQSTCARLLILKNSQQSNGLACLNERPMKGNFSLRFVTIGAVVAFACHRPGMNLPRTDVTCNTTCYDTCIRN